MKKPRPAKPDSIFKLTHANIYHVVPLRGGHEVLCARNADVLESIGLIERWNIDTGHRLAVFEGHTDAVRAVALAFGDARAMSKGDDHTLRLWDLHDGSCVQTFAIAADAIAVTDEGTHVVVASNDHMILLDLETGRREHTFRAHEAMSLAVVPGRGQVVSASRDCTLGLWDLTSGTCVHRFDANPKRETFVGHLGAWNPESATGVCVMADGTRIVACYGNGAVRCWDLESGELLDVTQCGDQWLICVAASPQGDEVLVGSWDCKVRLWRPGDPEPAELGRHDGEVSTVAFLGNGERAVSGSFDETLRVWDVANRAFVRMIGTPRESGLAPPSASLW